MTSRTRHCARLGIVLLGICCIASGIYLFRNWIDMFTRMRGQTFGLSFASRQIGNVCRGQLGDSFAYHLDWEATIFSIDLKQRRTQRH
uniref:Peste, isoform E n=2 Tax=Drosophila melanogaster TaxID=7227 RepID=M9PCW1_DROME|eukprot:NP_001260219.1 peste, isoform E [Drosophila melanogaster]